MKSEVECSKCFCDSLFHQLGKLDVSGEEKIEISKEVMRMICEALSRTCETLPGEDSTTSV